ncbi:MAG TPA: flagellar protein FlaG [Steroidobacteraceae bacterium]|nr:flagellar protein FlaG [Steroidobacteraceae bacterium]
MKVGEAILEADSRNQRKALPTRVTASTVEIVEKVPAAKPARPVEIPKIESVTRQIDTFLRSTNRALQFRVDDASGRMVVSITDAETGEVIRQVPGEEALRMAERIEASIGALLDEKV